MKYKLNNLITNQYEFFETQAEALEKLNLIKIQFIEKQSYIFTVAKEIVNGNDTMWVNANLDSDEENFDYHVFNPFLGIHEKINSLSMAKQRLDELKQQYIDTSFENCLIEVDQIINQIPMPSTVIN